MNSTDFIEVALHLTVIFNITIISVILQPLEKNELSKLMNTEKHEIEGPVSFEEINRPLSH